MRLRNHRVWIRTGLCAFALQATAAFAVVVDGHVEGRVNDFDNFVEGVGMEVFGLGAAELAGQPVRIDFRYDTALTPPDRAVGEPDRGSYRTEASTPRWLEMSVTLNGTTFEVDPNFQYAEVFSPFIVASDRFAYFQLSAERTQGFDFGQRRHFIDLSLDLPEGAITGGALPTAAATFTDVGHAVNGVAFRINDFDIDPVTGETTYLRRMGFHVDIDRLVLAPVPEPGVTLLLGLGLAGLAHRKRRESRSSPR